jgi:hypothetical protein
LRDETRKNRRKKMGTKFDIKNKAKCLRIKLKIKFNYENEKKM